MITDKRKIMLVVWISVSAILVLACGLSSMVNSGSSGEATPTPTELGGVVVITPTKEDASRCENLSASLELQVLVGPAEAVDLEPVAVGDIPFSVTTNQTPYLVEGFSTIDYQDMLSAEWGTYTVTFYMDVSVAGECTGEIGAEQIDLVLEMTKGNTPGVEPIHAMLFYPLRKEQPLAVKVGRSSYT